MTTLVQLDGEIVATVGATRAYLAPQIEALPEQDSRRALVLAMCEYALRIGDFHTYSDADAAEWARRRTGASDDR